MDPVLQRRQVLQQALDDRPPVQVRRRRQRLHQHQPRGRLAQRAEHRQPELLRIPLAWLSHDRSRTVFPLPGGAETTVTRADVPSRSNSLGRETIPPAPGPATPPTTASDPTADPMFPIIAPR